MSGRHVSPMETLRGRVVRIGDCLIRWPKGRSSLLGLVIPFEVGHPFLGSVIPFGISHPFWDQSSLLGSVISFSGRSSLLGNPIPISQKLSSSLIKSIFFFFNIENSQTLKNNVQGEREASVCCSQSTSLTHKR